jgi:hypothetical protein
VDDKGQHYARSEEYYILRIIERFSSPKKLVEYFEEFYDLDANWISHLMAYEVIRQSEEAVFAGVR